MRLRTVGALDYDDFQSSLTGMLAEGAQAYRKLLDAREGCTVLRDDEIAVLAAALKYRARVDVFGPHAVVVGADEGRAHEAMLSRMLQLGTRPIRIFFTVEEAHDWLKSQPVPGDLEGL
jgi:hypothetical protein